MVVVKYNGKDAEEKGAISFNKRKAQKILRLKLIETRT